VKEEIKMGEDDSAMQYDQDMIFRHLYVGSLLFPRLDTEPSHQVLLRRLTLERSRERNAGQTKREK
jgi:hypothetical protein